MKNNNGLIDVIEELLEADMTAPKKVKNPQNKMSEEEQVDEAQDKTDKSIAANKLTDTAKPKSGKEGDNSSEVIGSEKGAALDAGGDKDVGDMNKGKIASAASDNSKEVIGSEKGAALDGGADKDAGPKKDGKKAFPSDASSEVEANKGPHNQAMDEDTDEMVWDWDKIDELSEEDFNELVNSLDEEDLQEFKDHYNQAIAEEEELEEGQDTKIEKDANDEQLPDAEKESIKNMKEEDDSDDDDDDSDDDDDDSDDDKKESKESVEEEMEWDWEKIEGLTEEEFHDFYSNLTEEEQAEIEAHYQEVTEAKDKGDMDGDGKDEPDDEEYMDNKDKAIKKAMAKEESEEEIEELSKKTMASYIKKASADMYDQGHHAGSDPDDYQTGDYNQDREMSAADIKTARREKGIERAANKLAKEATGEKLEKAPTTSSNEPMRPGEEKGDNSPEEKGGNPGEGPHDQSKDPNATPTKANPKGAVKEEEEVDDKATTIEETFEESLDEDFKEKAAVIFEAAVNEKANKLAEEIEEKYATELEEEINKINEKVDQYVDYVVNEWLEENQLEIRYSLRTEIAENFIREMKSVFETNFIDIPEEEVSVVDELTEAVESYKEQIEEQTSELEAAKRELLEIKRKEIVDTIGEDLPQTQKIRLEKLSENVEADDIEEFRYKVEQLKEGYFDESSEQPLLSSLSEEVFGGAVIEEEDDSTVSQYAKFLSKTVTK